MKKSRKYLSLESVIDAYRLGQNRKALEKTAIEYDAWPRGLVKTCVSIAEDISEMTNEIRAQAEQKAGEIKIPENFLEKAAFNLGYTIGSNFTITNITSSMGPVNPFTNLTLYQEQ